MSITNLLRFLLKIVQKQKEYLEKKLHVVLQTEQLVLAEQKLRKFRKENPNRYEEQAKLFNDLRDEGAIEQAGRIKTGKVPCSHLKGGSLRLHTKGSPHRDYAVAFHTFPDGTKKIWCLICGKPWTPESPDWKQAVRMLEESSNTPSSSEVVLPEVQKGYISIRTPETQAVYHDPLFVIESAERPE